MHLTLHQKGNPSGIDFEVILDAETDVTDAKQAAYASPWAMVAITAGAICSFSILFSAPLGERIAYGMLQAVANITLISCASRDRPRYWMPITHPALGLLLSLVCIGTLWLVVRALYLRATGVCARIMADPRCNAIELQARHGMDIDRHEFRSAQQRLIRSLRLFPLGSPGLTLDDLSRI